MITITISGFKTKEQAIHWLNQYEGGIEQAFDTDEPEDDCFPATVLLNEYIPEMKEFKENTNKTNFNLELR